MKHLLILAVCGILLGMGWSMAVATWIKLNVR